MVVGDRDWRIIFSVDPAETVATIWVIGDRDEAACYEQAIRRLRAASARRPEADSLAAVMLRILQSRSRKPRR